jgi:hypothetical protein
VPNADRGDTTRHDYRRILLFASNVKTGLLRRRRKNEKNSATRNNNNVTKQCFLNDAKRPWSESFTQHHKMENKEKIDCLRMGKTKMGFSKYRDKTYEDVIRIDIDYVERTQKVVAYNAASSPEMIRFIAWLKSEQGKKYYLKTARKADAARNPWWADDDILVGLVAFVLSCNYSSGLLFMVTIGIASAFLAASCMYQFNQGSTQSSVSSDRFGN